MEESNGNGEAKKNETRENKKKQEKNKEKIEIKEEKIEGGIKQMKTVKVEINSNKKKGENKVQLKIDSNNENKKEIISNDIKIIVKKEEIKMDSNNNDNKDNNTKNEEKSKDSDTLKFENIDNVNDVSQLTVTMKIIESDMSNKKEYVLPQDFIEDKNRCNLLTQKLVNKTKKNANMKLEEFFSQKKGIF